MALTSLGECVRFLEELRLLEHRHLVRLRRLDSSAVLDARSLVRQLVRQGWLTTFQSDLLLAGRGRELAVGGCVLLDPVAEGTAGVVYRARQVALSRVVALKVLRHDGPGGLTAARFGREIRLAARLSHINLLTVHDAGVCAGRPYLTMEFLGGPDLHGLVRERGPLPTGEACWLLRQAASGLGHAHRRGLVHRDVKPANLGLTRRGVLKVLDLGLARGAGEATLTGAGAVLGTPEFMAPEQAGDSHAADARADLYSLGCVLFYLLTGRPPFAGGTAVGTLLRHQSEPAPDVRSERPDVPAGVAGVVARLLAKRPEDRFRSASELGRALAPFADAPRPQSGVH